MAMTIYHSCDIWYLDSLLTLLNKNGYYYIGKNTLCNIAWNAQILVEHWCDSQSLFVNPHKMNLFLVLHKSKKLYLFKTLLN